MAEINSTSLSSKKNGVQRSKKLSTRVDLTPMVDLGFLLITFFIFTTTMQESKAMRLIMPNDQQVTMPSKHPANKTMNIIIGGGDSVFFYNGIQAEEAKYVPIKQVRDEIINKKRSLENLDGHGKDLLILIKPTSHSSYNNIIQILDEMLINEIKLYMIIEPTQEEIYKSKIVQ